MAEVSAAAKRHQLPLHLDGARLMNACVATGRKPSEWTAHAESVSICFSKGLGAPVGSAVAGPADFIDRVHRYRKMFGGGMRQVGILAAAAIYALEHHLDRLADDHDNARRLGQALAQMPGIVLDPETVQTNIIIFGLSERLPPAAEFLGRLRDQGVWMLSTAPRSIRAVTHLDVSREQIDEAIRRIESLCQSLHR
jgi:threonine aldolase